MPIDKKQRQLNTLNKVDRLVKEAPDKVHNRLSNAQGRKGNELQRAAKNYDMDNATGTTDYSGGRDEHEEHRYQLREHAIDLHSARKGYSDLHDKHARKAK